MDERIKELKERLKNYADRVNLMEQDINFTYDLLVAAYKLGVEVGIKKGKEQAITEVQKNITLTKANLGLGL